MCVESDVCGANCLQEYNNFKSFFSILMIVDRGSACYLNYLHNVHLLQFLLVCFQVKEWHQTL